jgi:hypothetical protein
MLIVETTDMLDSLESGYESSADVDQSSEEKE